jgi:hypothetical protein
MTTTTTTTQGHPTAAQLASYVVRSDDADESVRAVRRHIEGGCEFCIVAVNRLLELVQRLGDEELKPARRGANWIVPRRTPVATASATPHRANVRIACVAGPYSLDLLLRECKAPAELRLVGQVTRAGRVYEPVPDLPIELVFAADSGVCAIGRTDAFGEFDFACPVARTYGLALGAGPSRPCVLLWDGEPR